MAEDDEFRPRLGRIGKGGRDRFLSRVLRAANLSGGVQLGAGSGKRRFDGSRIGRGAGVGRILAIGGHRGRYARRVVIKASIVRLGVRGLSRATAHMRYLQRDGTMRDGGRGGLYAAEGVEVDGKAFVERGAG